MTNVLYHQRRPGPGRFGLERAFSDVRRWLPQDIEASVAVCRFESRGVLRRIGNILAARRKKADVHHVAGDVHYLALGLDPSKTVLTIADCVSLHRSRGVRRFLLWAFWYYLPIRKARIVTAISEYVRDELVRFVDCDPGKVRVIHCPLSSSFTYVPRHFPVGTPTILQVGTGPTKNVDRVIEALKGIRCRLWIVGPLDADQIQLLETCGTEYQCFSHVSDEDLVSLYVRSDLVIFASTYEGFGLPIIEAQAVGRPVIASKVASSTRSGGRRRRVCGSV